MQVVTGMVTQEHLCHILFLYGVSSFLVSYIFHFLLDFSEVILAAVAFIVELPDTSGVDQHLTGCQHTHTTEEREGRRDRREGEGETVIHG